MAKDFGVVFTSSSLCCFMDYPLIFRVQHAVDPRAFFSAQKLLQTPVVVPWSGFLLASVRRIW